MDNNDYEKAKEDCWREWTYDARSGMSLSELAEARRVFNFAFDRAYQLGKALAQPANGLVNERLQVAAIAMQGILASPSIMAATTVSLQTEAAKQGMALQNEEVSELTINAMAAMAVQSADALLTELEKEKP